MASMYDKIKTAKDLVSEVAMHGLSTKTEDIVRAQDIFGHTSVGELIALSQDNGHHNDKGEPDPRGSWADDKPDRSETFYLILFHIWNWREATEFFNKNSNYPLIDKLEKLSKMDAALDKVKKERDELESKLNAALKVQGENDALNRTIHEQYRLICELKAKLYDISCAEAKQNNANSTGLRYTADQICCMENS